MKEQTFIIGGVSVTFLAPDLLSQEEAEALFSGYVKDGPPGCPFAVSLGHPVSPDYYEPDYREPPYVAHMEESELQNTQEYIEYCQYAQRLQTELGEGSIFISDEINRIGLTLAGIEEKRIKLAGKESDLKRQLSYLNTINSLLTKRKQDLNREYEQTAKENRIGNGGGPKRVTVENEQSHTTDEGFFF